MAVRQLTVFLENRAGRLTDIITLLSENGIDIRAFCLAEKAEYGILRLIVDDPGKAAEIARKRNFSVNEMPVIVAEVEDKPGGLAAVLHVFVESGLNIEYMYVFIEKRGDKALLVFSVDDVAKAERALDAGNIGMFNDDRMRSL